jgi:hypothetical protein
MLRLRPRRQWPQGAAPDPVLGLLLPPCPPLLLLSRPPSAGRCPPPSPLPLSGPPRGWAVPRPCLPCRCWRLSARLLPGPDPPQAGWARCLGFPPSQVDTCGWTTAEIRCCLGPCRPVHAPVLPAQTCADLRRPATRRTCSSSRPALALLPAVRGRPGLGRCACGRPRPFCCASSTRVPALPCPRLPCPTLPPPVNVPHASTKPPQGFGTWLTRVRFALPHKVPQAPAQLPPQAPRRPVQEAREPPPALGPRDAAHCFAGQRLHRMCRPLRWAQIQGRRGLGRARGQLASSLHMQPCRRRPATHPFPPVSCRRRTGQAGKLTPSGPLLTK